MGYGQAGSINNGTTVEEYVDVDGTRPLCDQALSAHGAFDALNAGEQLAWEQTCLDFDNHVEKPGLIEELARFRFVDGGSAEDGEVAVLEEAQGAFESGFASTDIGAKGKIGDPGHDLEQDVLGAANPSGDTEIFEGAFGGEAAAGGAVEKSELHEIGLVNLLNGVGLLIDGSGDGVDADGSAAVFLEQR